MARIFWLLLLVCVAACEAPRHAALPAGATVLVVGDSVTYGTGASPGEDYPTLLARLTGWNVINAGVPGDTTEGGLKRLPSLLEAHAPQLLLVELGGNDFLRRLPSSQTRHNLKAILSQARARGVPAVLVAVPRPNLMGAALRSLSDDPLYADLAEETQTPLIADILSETLSRNELKADPIHPNAAGYRRVAEGMAEELRALGFLR